MKSLAMLLIILLVSSTGSAFAHRDGCHSNHSCQSDTGSYICGDKGMCSQCSDNNYCKAGQSAKQTTPIILKKQTVNEKVSTNSCIGNAMCIQGKVKSIIDGDTLYVDTYKVRLSLTNTPEKGQAGYTEATKFTKSLCIVGSSVIVDQDDRQPFDKFKRVVGKVYCSDKNLNEQLLYKNHATIMKKYCSKSEFGTESWATKFGC